MSVPVNGPAATHLFFYWRVAPVEVEAALAAVRDWHRLLRQRHPTLAPRLYVRQDAGRCTVMESYEGDEACLSVLVDEGNRRTAGWRHGERHLERFADAG